MSTPFYRFMYAVFNPVMRVLYRIKVENPELLPREGGTILCANHTSMADVVVLSAACGGRQIRYMAKKELFAIPGLKQLITALGAYPVDRTGMDVRSIKNTIAMLEKGELVGIFPQGTRRMYLDPTQTPVRAGIGMIEYRSHATVVPVFLKTKKNRVRPFCRTTIIFGEPVPFDALPYTAGGTKEFQAVSESLFAKTCALGGYEASLPFPRELPAKGAAPAVAAPEEKPDEADKDTADNKKEETSAEDRS